jgi:hypothetical protein
MKNSLFLILIFTLLFASCTDFGQVSEEPDDQGKLENSGTVEYPSVVEPVSGQPTVTASVGLGTVRGKLLFNGAPVSQTNLFLAQVIADANGLKFAAGLNPFTDPMSVTEEDGSFEFRNVTPGEYTLILDQSTSMYILYTPDTQDGLIFDVENGSVVDLGVLDYDDLPIAK